MKSYAWLALVSAAAFYVTAKAIAELVRTWLVVRQCERLRERVTGEDRRVMEMRKRAIWRGLLRRVK